MYRIYGYLRFSPSTKGDLEPIPHRYGGGGSYYIDRNQIKIKEQIFKNVKFGHLPSFGKSQIPAQEAKMAWERLLDSILLAKVASDEA